MVCCIMGGYTKHPEHNLARKMRKLNSAYRIALIAHRSVRVRIDYIECSKMKVDLILKRQIQMLYTHSFGMDIKMVANAATQDTNTF